MNLKELRKKHNLTQGEVAEKLFITQTGYSSYENEKTQPPIETMCKLADLYNVSLDTLVGREFSNDIGFLNDQQKSLLKISKELNQLNLITLIGYASGLLAGQK